MAEDDSKRIVLYQHIMDELKELRNERWKLALYFTSIALGNILLLKERDLFVNELQLFRISSISIQAISIIIFVWLIFRNHKYLTRTRAIRNKLEKTFDFYQEKDKDGNPILPPEWKYQQATVKFELIDVTIPIVAFTALCQIMTIIIMVSI